MRVAPVTAATAQTHQYPINVDLRDQSVLVVGGGRVAAHKVAGLIRAGARVTVVAPDADRAIGTDRGVRWHRREYQRGEAASYRLVITATSDSAVNEQVFRDGEAANVMVNSADDPERCRFTMPSVARHGDVQVTVSTNGRSPALAAWLRRQVSAGLGPEVEALLELLEAARVELRAGSGSSEHEGWSAALDDGLLELIRSDRHHDARVRLRAHLNLPPEPAGSQMEDAR
ncbi:MAG: precorrin-2 dehydrogenase/sirohydrochlorin ferrochelatase family protein [Microthrixaceae bacterium]